MKSISIYDNQGETFDRITKPFPLGEVKIKHFLQYSIYSKKVSWCPICKQHFYNDRNEKHTTIATIEHYHEI